MGIPFYSIEYNIYYKLMFSACNQAQPTIEIERRYLIIVHSGLILQLEKCIEPLEVKMFIESMIHAL